MTWRIGVVVTVLVALAPGISSAQEGFPLRSVYRTVDFVSTEDLDTSYARVTIVDVRSAVEFGVIHIKKAVHLPVARVDFVDRLEKLVKGDKGAALVFYCNGHTCAKSYKAVVKAQEAGFSNARAYDAGIFEWTQAHPDRATLLGKSPADPSKMISADEFQAHLLDKDDFAKLAVRGNAILIDAREPIQRKKTPEWAKKAQNWYAERLVQRLQSEWAKKQSKTKTFYIFDSAGKQVRWFQYHLEAQGFENYFFLDGGIYSIYGKEGAN